MVELVKPPVPDNVISLDEYRPHVCLELHDSTFRAVSCNRIEAFIRGDIELEQLAILKVDGPSARHGTGANDWRVVLRRIVEEWYERLKHA